MNTNLSNSRFVAYRSFDLLARGAECNEVKDRELSRIIANSCILYVIRNSCLLIYRRENGALIYN